MPFDGQWFKAAKRRCLGDNFGYKFGYLTQTAWAHNIHCKMKRNANHANLHL